MPVAVLAGRLRSPHQVILAWPEGEAKLGPRVVLFMHFDGRGFVRQQLLDYMRELKENGRDVVFVTNSEKLTPYALEAVKELCAAVLVRRNIGYDFGAWADALHHLGLPRADTQEIIFANDSVFGPLLPLGDVLRRLNYEKSDIWGLTESWQVRYHLQSFFLGFGPKALRAEAFGKFWSAVRPVPAKAYVVHKYEIGITQAMMAGGLSCNALWAYETLLRMVNRDELDKLIELEASELGRNDPVQVTRKLQILRIRDGAARRVALNPTSDLWRQLLLTGFPFIKRELLRDNPSKVQDVGDWAEVVREVLGADPEPIRQDLRLMLKGKAP
ncbi:MAG: lipopolysaccharide biosynthesis protein [Rhodospirillales bacterium]|nr:lipopolysaccharide biosynthesis protein [Rhodospirillales bacterium]MDE2319500.1 lipopolysaccharide biosynthesis protein [Rhodospirillales bacterium]